MKFNVKFEGIEQLRKALNSKERLKKVQNAVKASGGQLQEQAMRNAKFRGHYRNGQFISPTGYTKRNIMLDIKDNGLTAEISSKSEYSGFLEFGTRYMSAQPFMGPAVRSVTPKFKKNITEALKEK